MENCLQMKNQVEVFGTIKLEISSNLEGVREVLNSYNTELYDLTLTTTGGKTITLKVHDVDIEWEKVFDENE